MTDAGPDVDDSMITLPFNDNISFHVIFYVDSNIDIESIETSLESRCVFNWNKDDG